MQTTIAITSTSVDRFVKNAKLFSYVMTSFSKAYCEVNKNQMVFYFKGTKSLLTFSLALESPIKESICFSVDISKLLSGIRKVYIPTRPLLFIISDTPPTVTIHTATSIDKISFSVSTYDKSTPEIASLLTFFEDKKPLFSGKSKLKITQALLDFATITGAYMSTINKNNAIQITPDSLMYSDRTIVIKRFEKVLESSELQELKAHKFVLGFMDYVLMESDELLVSTSGEFVKWESIIDPSFKAILAIDPCVIGIPSDDDIQAIIPEDQDQEILEVTPADLLTSIEFFSGLFEASIWKPITFTWKKDAGLESVRLSYRHPTTEIEKDLIFEKLSGSSAATEASFTLISDSLRVLLTKLEPYGKVLLHFNDKNPDDPHGAGILLEYYTQTDELQYTAVFAKLSE